MKKVNTSKVYMQLVNYSYIVVLSEMDDSITDEDQQDVTSRSIQTIGFDNNYDPDSDRYG